MKSSYFLFLMLASFGLCAQTPAMSWSVIAPSGLSVRDQPSLDGKKLGAVAFQDSIHMVGDWTENHLPHRQDTIDGNIGYWIEVEFQGQSGYMFSGFLRVGPWYVRSTDINREYRVLFPGLRCQSVNYDPDLHWYGISWDPKHPQAQLKAVSPEVVLPKGEDWDLEVSYAGANQFLEVQSQLPGQYFQLLIGVPTPLSADTVGKFAFDLHHPHTYQAQGRFIFPTEKVLLGHFDQKQYYLTAQEVAFLDTTYEGELTANKRYELWLDTQPYAHGGGGDWTATNLSEALGLEHLHPYQYSMYQGPKLLWQGDVNEDGFPDAIFYTPPMSECCGGTIGFTFLVSEKEGDLFRWKKVAAEHIEACFGC